MSDVSVSDRDNANDNANDKDNDNHDTSKDCTRSRHCVLQTSDNNSGNGNDKTMPSSLPGVYACGGPPLANLKDDTSVTSFTSLPDDTLHQDNDHDKCLNPAEEEEEEEDNHNDNPDDDDDDDDKSDQDSLAEQWARRESGEHLREARTHTLVEAMTQNPSSGKNGKLLEEYDSDADDGDDDSLAEQWTRRESEHLRRSSHRDNGNACGGCDVDGCCHNDDTSVTSFTSNQDDQQQDARESLRARVPASYRVFLDNGVIQVPDLEPGKAVVFDENLAVAKPLDDHDNEWPIPAAVEYDPDAKPTLQQSRKPLYTILVACTLALTAVAIVVGFVIASNSKGGSNGDLHPREKLGIREAVVEIIGNGNVLQSPASPYSKALQWITLQDEMQLIPHESDNFAQRYLLAYFYYATTETRRWDECNPIETNEIPAKQASSSSSSTSNGCSYLPVLDILSRDNYYRGGSPIYGQRWLSVAHECDWAGVDCNDAMQVDKIEFSGQGLNGWFPEGIFHLSSLRSLKLDMNELRGTLPTSIVALSNLEFLFLRFNRLGGIFPEELWEMTKLRALELSGNQFQGTLSPKIAHLADLTDLELNYNKLSGEIPEEIGSLANLDKLGLASNSFRGTIPTELGMLMNLKGLGLQNNNFSGTLPSGLVFLPLGSLQTGGNPLLGGEFPPGIWDITTLHVLEIPGCNFTGSIANGVGNMLELDHLVISGNPFTGTVPSSLGNIMKLRSLRIDGTNINGTMPQEVCARRSFEEEWSLLGFWEEIKADCLGNPPEIECACCTDCCRTDGTGCEAMLP